ncbi:MAG: DUF924 domain-containing protein [Proteobacteria bacterium]|nr:DUF924 domain-containing protein [Pseudomonadota bacterium]
MDITADEVLGFWFHETDRQNWFERSDDFDGIVRDRFAAAVETARGGGFDAWRDTARGGLAVIILIDQFSRNLHRDSPRAWSADDVALSCTRQALARAHDRELAPEERKFLYMPLMHSEDLVDQEKCVELFRALAEESAEEKLALDYAIRHRDIIARFGRFPHRNAILGRQSTPEEIDFLKEPDSSF